jgi:hypothetical protein
VTVYTNTGNNVREIKDRNCGTEERECFNVKEREEGRREEYRQERLIKGVAKR